MFKILMPDTFLALIKPSTKGENVWLDFFNKKYRKSWLFLMETPNITHSTGQELVTLLGL